MENPNTSAVPFIPGVTQNAGFLSPQSQQQLQQHQQAETPQETDWSKVTKQDLIAGKYPEAPGQEVLRIMNTPEAQPPATVPRHPAGSETPAVLDAQTVTNPEAFNFVGSVGEEAFALDMETLIPTITEGFANLDFAAAAVNAAEAPDTFNSLIHNALTQAVTSALVYSQSAVFKGLNSELPAMFNSYHGAVDEATLNTNLQSLDIDTPSLQPIVSTLGQAYRAANPNASNAEVLAAVKVQLKAVHDAAQPTIETPAAKQSTDWSNPI